LKLQIIIYEVKAAMIYKETGQFLTHHSSTMICDVIKQLKSKKKKTMQAPSFLLQFFDNNVLPHPLICLAIAHSLILLFQFDCMLGAYNFKSKDYKLN
jgi:hypothetical protein